MMTGGTNFWHFKRRYRAEQAADARRQYSAVAAGIEKLRAALKERSPQEMTWYDLTAITSELNYLLALTPDPSIKRQFAIPADSSQIDSYLETLSRIVAVHLDALGRHRASQRTIDVAGAQAVASPCFSAARDRTQPDTAASTDETQPESETRSSSPPPERLQPSEAALLAAVTEKFYSSWSFKGLAAALVAAVALAGGGTFLLAGQSFRLSEQLDTKYKDAIDQMDKVQTKAQDSLKQQSEALKTANDAVQNQAAQFGATAEKALSDLHAQQQTFERNLKASSVDQVVSNLREDLSRRTGPISAGIAEMQTKADGINTQVAAANSKLATLASNIDVSGKTLDGLTPRLVTLQTQVNMAIAQTETIKSEETAANAAKTGAERGEAVARQAASDAAAHRDTLVAQLNGVANSIPSQQAALDNIKVAVGSMQGSLRQVAEDVAGAKGDAAKLQQISASLREINDKASALDRNLSEVQRARLTERVAVLEATRLAPSQPVVRHVESLTEPERCAVQRELTANGFPSGVIDGVLGNSTRAAVQKWQRSIGETDNGNLTPEQINRLIGTDGVPACPPRPATRRVRRA